MNVNEFLRYWNKIEELKERQNKENAKCLNKIIESIKFKGEDKMLRCENCGKEINYCDCIVNSQMKDSFFCCSKCRDKYFNKGEDNMDKYERGYTFKEVIANIKDGEEYIVTQANDLKVISKDYDGYIKFEGKLGKSFYVDNDIKFKLKRKEREVDVIEAIKQYDREGKTIICKYNSRTYTYTPDDECDGHHFNPNCTIDPFLVIDGTWFILD